MRCLQRERHDRYPDWKAFVNVLTMAAARRGITVAPFVPKMRYQASARGAGVLRARVAGGAVVTGRGGEGRASVDVRGAARDVDEAKRLAGSRRLEGRRRPPLARRPALGRARASRRPAAADGGSHVRARPPRARPRGGGRDRRSTPCPARWKSRRSCSSPWREAHLALGHAPLAERAARAGLTVHDGNPKLLECLLEAQRAQGLFSDAVATARQRLAVSRDARLSLDGGRAARRARRARLRGAPSRGVLVPARSGLPSLGGTRAGASRSVLETSARACVRGARALAGGARRPRGNHGRARPAPRAGVRRASCEVPPQPSRVRGLPRAVQPVARPVSRQRRARAHIARSPSPKASSSAWRRTGGGWWTTRR